MNLIENVLLDLIKKNHNILKDLDRNLQTPAICLASVELDGLNLEYVNPEFQTHDLCLSAIKQNILAFKFVKVQTHDICYEAVKINGTILCYVNDIFQTHELCLAAIKQDACVLKFVKNQTEELCNAVAEQNPFALYFYMNDKMQEKLLSPATRQA